MEATAYWSLIREMKDAYNHRLRLVAYARQNGLKAAARAFQTTRRTVRKWARAATRSKALPACWSAHARPTTSRVKLHSTSSRRSWLCAVACPPSVPAG